ncbi:MAG: hypothetical protein ACLP01_28400 [Solirubrobacteraceae bacterium]
MSHFKRRYGATPLHLLLHVLAFAIAAYAMVQLLGEKRWVNFLGWFLAAALLHDLVLLPLYTALDRVGSALSRTVHVHLPGGPRAAEPGSPQHVPLVNHVRAPALISGVLLLIYFPLILGPAQPGYLSASGHNPTGYLRNWLLITAALFAGSAVIYAMRVARRRRSSPRAPTPSPTSGGPTPSSSSGGPTSSSSSGAPTPSSSSGAPGTSSAGPRAA